MAYRIWHIAEAEMVCVYDVQKSDRDVMQGVVFWIDF